MGDLAPSRSATACGQPAGRLAGALVGVAQKSVEVSAVAAVLGGVIIRAVSSSTKLAGQIGFIEYK